MTSGFLSVEGLVKHFGGIRALEGVNLALGAGEVKCIIGPNGCGKSTLFNILTGTLTPTSGTVSFNGQRIDGKAAHQISRLGVGRKFQVPGVFSDLNVLEHLEVAGLGRKTQGGLLATLRQKGDHQLYKDYLQKSGLWDYANQIASELPHGIKQRLELLMLVARGTRLLLLDEPTAGMTAQETSDTIDLIRLINQETGAAILVIEHDMTFVRKLECPLVVMMRGKVIREGSYEDIRQDPEVRSAYLGDRA